MKKLLVLLIFCSMVYSEDIVSNPEVLYKVPVSANNTLTQKVTLNWKFSTFNDFTVLLQKTYGIKYRILSIAANPSSPITLYVDNVSLEELINQASNKFGYSWEYKESTALFKAINPVIMPFAIKSKGFVSNWSLTPNDKTLRTALSRWCKTASWQLIWNVRADYPITTNWNITGSFESAVNEVLKASQDTDMPLQAIMHDGNHVLEITSPISIN